MTADQLMELADRYLWSQLDEAEKRAAVSLHSAPENRDDWHGGGHGRARAKILALVERISGYPMIEAVRARISMLQGAISLTDIF